MAVSAEEKKHALFSTHNYVIAIIQIVFFPPEVGLFECGGGCIVPFFIILGLTISAYLYLLP
jgi:hypothetical protein